MNFFKKNIFNKLTTNTNKNVLNESLFLSLGCCTKSLHVKATQIILLQNKAHDCLHSLSPHSYILRCLCLSGVDCLIVLKKKEKKQLA